MPELGVLILLYAVGMLILLAEIFIPSHGVLTVAGLLFLGAAVVKTFDVGGRSAGVTSVVLCLILLPTFAYLSIKYWPKTPIGRRIAPPNRVATDEDAGIPIEQLRALVGSQGTSISPLRPVGICEFDGKRFSCVADFGIVDSGRRVVVTGVRNGNLAVRAESA